MRFSKKNFKIIIITIIASILIVVCKMMSIPSAIITLIILSVSTVLFITELIPIGATAACIPFALYLTGVISVKETFSGFSNENVILFAAMFVIGGALFRSGVTELVGNFIVYYSKGNKKRLLLYLMISVGGLSSVMSNTGCVAVLLPVCIGIADASNWDRKDLLLPLAMMASLGGTITLVGTPPNLTVNSVLAAFEYEGFSFFEFAYIGLPLAVFGGAILLLVYGKGKQCIQVPIVDETTKLQFSLQNSLDPKQKAAVLILLGVVMVMATGIVNLSVAASIGAMICLFTRLVSKEDALQDIDWTTIFLFAGTLPMADALDKTGAGQMIANMTVKLVGEAPSEVILLTVIFFITCGLTQFMSNTACAALLSSIGLQIALGIGANPRGVLMAIALASSSAFATPMATPPNTLIMGPAKVKFSDYYKIGVPLIAVSYLVCIIIIPIVWPLF